MTKVRLNRRLTVDEIVNKRTLIFLIVAGIGVGIVAVVLGSYFPKAAPASIEVENNLASPSATLFQTSPTPVSVIFLDDVRADIVLTLDEIDPSISDEDFINLIKNLRSKIANASAQADGQVKLELEDWDKQLEEIEQEVASDIGAALSSFEEMVDRLQVKIDDNQQGRLLN